MATSELVAFNVIGTIFCLKRNLFDAHKSSLLYTILHEKKIGSLLPSCIIHMNESEFFIQRSPDLFKIIVLYCITGKLHIPSNMCSDEVLDEFQFWKINCKDSCIHCSNHINNALSNDPCEEVTIDENTGGCTVSNFRSKLWTFMQNPHSSVMAAVLFITSMLVIMLSILNIILSSMPQLQHCTSNVTAPITLGGTRNDTDPLPILDSKSDTKTDCSGTLAFNIIDIFCMIWFSLELFLRLISCPNYKKFMIAPTTIVDILSILPFYFEIVIWAVDVMDKNDEKAKTILLILRICKVFQIMRILKLARYSMNLKVLGKTFMSAKEYLWMLLVFIFIASLVFSNCIYEFEKDQIGTKFVSIPATFWWCIVTLTTVGYGDMEPQTTGGKIVAGLACVCGILLIAFPIAVLVDKFQKTYNEQKIKEKAKIHRKTFFALRHSFSNNRKESSISNTRKESAKGNNVLIVPKF